MLLFLGQLLSHSEERSDEESSAKAIKILRFTQNDNKNKHQNSAANLRNIFLPGSIVMLPLVVDK